MPIEQEDIKTQPESIEKQTEWIPINEERSSFRVGQIVVNPQAVRAHVKTPLELSSGEIHELLATIGFDGQLILGNQRSEDEMPGGRLQMNGTWVATSVSQKKKEPKANKKGGDVELMINWEKIRLESGSKMGEIVYLADQEVKKAMVEFLKGEMSLELDKDQILLLALQLILMIGLPESGHILIDAIVYILMYIELAAMFSGVNIYTEYWTGEHAQEKREELFREIKRQSYILNNPSNTLEVFEEVFVLGVHLVMLAIFAGVYRYIYELSLPLIKYVEMSREITKLRNTQLIRLRNPIDNL